MITETSKTLVINSTTENFPSITILSETRTLIEEKIAEENDDTEFYSTFFSIFNHK